MVNVLKRAEWHHDITVIFREANELGMGFGFTIDPNWQAIIPVSTTAVKDSSTIELTAADSDNVILKKGDIIKIGSATYNILTDVTFTGTKATVSVSPKVQAAQAATSEVIT